MAKETIESIRAERDLFLGFKVENEEKIRRLEVLLTVATICFETVLAFAKRVGMSDKRLATLKEAIESFNKEVEAG